MASVAQSSPGHLLHYRPVVDDRGQPTVLGVGAYSTVYHYRNTKTGEDVAIKRVALTGASSSAKDLLPSCLERELLNHHMLNHPHVLKLKDVFLTQHHLNLVLELAKGGMLFEHVQNRLKEVGHMAEAEARWYFQQLVLTMDYFHTKGVAHRDIKLENTLLQTTPTTTWHIIKVADFGFSKHNAHHTYTSLGTLAYMSPEVLQAQHPNKERPGQGYNALQADIWSAGVVLFTMLAGHYPFDPEMPERYRLQRMQHRPLTLPAHLSQAVRTLLEGLLHPDPAQRYTITQVMRDPWFLQGLPAGALSMGQAYLQQPSPCVKSWEEVTQIVKQALEVMRGGAAEPQSSAVLNGKREDAAHTAAVTGLVALTSV